MTGARLDDLDRPARFPVPDLRSTVEARLAEQGIAFHDTELAEAGVRALLRLMGDDPTRSGVLDTPKRVVKAMRELSDRPGDPATLLATTFDDAGPVDQMVAVGPMPFVSLCEHHLLPFTGDAWVAYLPTQAGVVGLSKIPRLLEHFARRPQVQERLTGQITDALLEHVGPDAACYIRATHSCATSRGVRKAAPMTTSSLHGAFRDDPTLRTEFLALAR